MTKVAVVGGGIAGLTAGLRLAERGCEVTLYEQQPMLGGNLASIRDPDEAKQDGVQHDVYPHMYLNWYENFWHLIADVTGTTERKPAFVPMDSVKQIGKGDFPRFASLTNAYSLSFALRNMFSGVAPPADQFLFGYASIDLLAERLNPTMLLDEISVNGFLAARPYMTERAAEAFNSWITRVWAVPSYLASATDYQTFLKHGYANPAPALWLNTGSAEDCIIGPIAAALDKAGAKIHLSTSVTGIECADGRVHRLRVKEKKGDKRTDPVEELVLAVPPTALSELIRKGERGKRVVDAEVALADVARMRTENIPIVHLYFNRVLKDIPREPVGLVGAKYGLAFTDVSQTRPDVREIAGRRTVLALSASDRYGLPQTNDKDDAMAMIRELSLYITSFRPGRAWGDSMDIDWEKTTFDADVATRLFINEIGSDDYRPPATCTTLENMYLAGDFCQNHVGLTSVEAAVVSGLNAAKAVAERCDLDPIEIIEPKDFSPLLFAWLRIMWAPSAAAAKWWSTASDLFHNVVRTRPTLSQLRQLFSVTPSRPQR